MIPVAAQPEPPDFDAKVRTPGKAFLKINPNPTTWKECWRNCLWDLYESYGRICSYSAHWFSRCEGIATVDHFIPKSKNPSKAYEWDNFRLATLRMNSLKKDYQDVLDPFRIAKETFILDFTTLFPGPGPKVSKSLAGRVRATIRRLKLDDNVCVEARTDWLQLYCDKHLTFKGLVKRAPFLAYEIKRQGLSAASLRKIFRRPKNSSS